MMHIYVSTAIDFRPLSSNNSRSVLWKIKRKERKEHIQKKKKKEHNSDLHNRKRIKQ